MKKNKIVVVGATSAIAQRLMEQYIDSDFDFFLIARNGERLQAVANNIRAISNANVDTFVMDACEYEKLNELKAALFESKLEVVIVAHGILSDQKECQKNIEYAAQCFSVNATSYVAFLTFFADLMKAQRFGRIVAIASVAGLRGRKSNYYYGAAKASVITFMQGLSQDLKAYNIKVTTVLPGFVDTPMTRHLKKGLLWAHPSRVAKDIKRAVARGRPVCFTPSFWRWIMLVVKNLPSFLVNKLP